MREAMYGGPSCLRIPAWKRRDGKLVRLFFLWVFSLRMSQYQFISSWWENYFKVNKIIQATLHQSLKLQLIVMMERIIFFLSIISHNGISVILLNIDVICNLDIQPTFRVKRIPRLSVKTIVNSLLSLLLYYMINTLIITYFWSLFLTWPTYLKYLTSSKVVWQNLSI